PPPDRGGPVRVAERLGTVSVLRAVRLADGSVHSALRRPAYEVAEAERSDPVVGDERVQRSPRHRGVAPPRAARDRAGRGRRGRGGPRRDVPPASRRRLATSPGGVEPSPLRFPLRGT